MEDQILDDGLLPATNTTKEVRWAGFWIRVGAHLVDLIIYLPLNVLSYYNVVKLKNMGFQIIILFIILIYKPLMESIFGSTLGKMAVKIKVVNQTYDNITISQAFIRNIPWLLGHISTIATSLLLFLYPDFFTPFSTKLHNIFLSSKMTQYLTLLFMFVSCITVATTQKKRGLHDMMADTYCIYK